MTYRNRINDSRVAGKVLFSFFLSLFVFPIYGAETIPGEIVNRVRYVIGNIPVTEIDIDEMEQNLRYYDRSGKKSGRRAAENELVERAIVRLVAEEESLMVTDARVENEIKRRRNASGVSSAAQFEKMIESQTGMPYDLWYREMPYQILRSQVIQLLVPVSMPSENEMQSFYNKNRAQMGVEIAYREIIFAPENITEERRLSKISRELWGTLRQDPSSFEKWAKTHPDNVSTRSGLGGYCSHVPIHEIARLDERLASVLYRLNEGEVGPIFRDSNNRYMIVKLEDKRPTSFEKMKNVIIQRLLVDREEEAFAKWIKTKKKEIAITRLE